MIRKSLERVWGTLRQCGCCVCCMVALQCMGSAQAAEKDPGREYVPSEAKDGLHTGILPAFEASKDLLVDAPPHLDRTATMPIEQIVVTGVSVIDQLDIQELINPYLERDVNASELHALRQALTKLYVSRGYITSGVKIPNQKIDSGVVRMHATEGELTRIDVVGNARLRPQYVQQRIQRRLNKALNLEDLRYALRWLQRDPLVDRIHARLAPGASLGESILELELEEPPAFRASISSDNYNSSSVGEFRGRIGFHINNLSGYGETFQATTSLSEGADETSASLRLPITSTNLSLTTYYAQSDAEIVEDAFDALDIESVTDTWGLSIDQPLIDNLQHNLNVGIGVESRSSKSTLLGESFSLSPGSVNGRSKTFSLLARLEYTYRAESQLISFRGTYRQGLDARGASRFDPLAPFAELNNPTGADGEFDLWLAQATHVVRLNRFAFLGGLHSRAQLVTRFTLQRSNDPLMSLEKIAIGGINTVRGYSENLLVRDNGLTASLELQLPVFGYQADPHLRNLIIAPFVDFGRSWDEEDTDPLSLDRDTTDPRYIASLGLGLHWRPLRGMNLSIYYGYDVADNFENDDPRSFRSTNSIQDQGVHLSFSYQRSL